MQQLFHILPEVHTSSMFKPFHLDGNIGYAIGFHTNPLRQRHAKPTSNSFMCCTSQILALLACRNEAKSCPWYQHIAGTILEPPPFPQSSLPIACSRLHPPTVARQASAIVAFHVLQGLTHCQNNDKVLILSNVIHTRKRSVKQAFRLYPMYPK